MKVKILAGEYLFDKQGLHILDGRGFATKAAAEVEVEVLDEKYTHVRALLAADRGNRGLDVEGNPILSTDLESPTQTEESQNVDG
jgi:hypothetical protein